MLSKFKQKLNLGSSIHEELEEQVQFIQAQFSNGMLEALEETFLEKISNEQNSNYNIENVKEIIDGYAKQNMILAAATSIVPGPLGILGSVPELILNFRNQMGMIYDLGCAYGKENFINKDVLLDIPIAAFGGNTNLSSLQLSDLDLEDSPKNIIVEKIKDLSQSIVERTLKKSIVQFIPVAGPILMGTWSKMTTKKISNVSCSFLDKTENYQEHHKPDEDGEVKRRLQVEKIKALANLIESNNEINENQIDLIETIIRNSVLTEEEQEFYMKESLRVGSKFEIDKTLLKDFEEEDDLVMEMVVMAKRSGSLDQLERDYIYSIGEYLEVEKILIDELI